MLLDPRRPDERSKTVLADKVFEWLTEQIISGTLRPGQWLSENEVAAELGVSRSPVREALQSFAREGLVRTRRGIGTIVAELGAAEIDDIYRARQLVDSELIGLAVERMEDAHIAQMQAIIADERAAIGDAIGFYNCTVRMWQLMMDICPNRAICEMVAMLWRRSIRFRGLLYTATGWRSAHDVIEAADRLVTVAQARDGDAARALIVENLENVRRTLLEELFIDMDNGRVLRPVLAPSGRR